MSATSLDLSNPNIMLAKYDTQRVPDDTLVKIFRCTLADLADARATEEYVDALAQFTAEATEQVSQRANMWDAVEQSALTGLVDALPLATDPKFLLLAARTANQAARPQHTQAATIDVSKQGPDRTTVIRLRRTFTEALENPDGVRKLVRREDVAELESIVGRDAIPTAREVESLLERIMKVNVRSGMPQVSLTDGMDLLNDDDWTPNV